MSEWTRVSARPNTRNHAAKSKLPQLKTSTPVPKDKISAVSGSKLKGRKPLRDSSARENVDNNNVNNNNNNSKKEPPFIPKTINDINKIFNVNDLRQQISVIRSRNSLRPNVWLNELVTHFVSKCSIFNEKTTFSNKEKLEQYNEKDWITLDPEIEKLLKSVLHDDTEYYMRSHVRATLYHETLLNMVEAALRNQSIVGYKLFLYFLAKNFGSDCAKSVIDRIYFHSSQGHGYRSNPTVAIPLLWAMGLPFLLAGSVSGSNGMKVFTDGIFGVFLLINNNHSFYFYFSYSISTSEICLTQRLNSN